VLGILDQDGVTESERALQLLGEGIIQETCDCKTTILAFILEELRCPAGRIDDERVPVEALEYNGVLSAQVVDR
jgi:hypothetical protein